VTAKLHQVETGAAPIERFRPLLDRDVWSALNGGLAQVAQTMHDRVLWNVNSTARGGGVAELLASLIPYDRGAGIDERWLVIEGSPDFFKVTKKIHGMLHGVASDGARLSAEEEHQYELVTANNAGPLLELIHPGDVVILHDPQTVGLIPSLTERGAHVVWRSHIGVDTANDIVRDAWKFLRPYLDTAGACVFSRASYVWEGLDPGRVRVIAPCIDPFSTKNADLDRGSVRAILHAAGVVNGTNASEASFTRNDGTRGRVTRPANMTEPPLPEDSRIVLQVSRWDRLKDPAGVLDAFAEHVAPNSSAWLVLAGPAATSVDDDPEQPQVLADLNRRREQLPSIVRRRVVIAQLPMQDGDENAAIVNALQRRADVVVQKSVAEGFGLTVAEAMWKSRPVVASRIGGIEDQIENGTSGVLIDDPRDLAAFGRAVVDLLDDEPRATKLGAAARARVTHKFISPCYLIEQAQLISELAGN
jgi:trehalose synthase